MICENELRFLCTSLEKLHVRTALVTGDTKAEDIIVSGFSLLNDNGRLSDMTVEDFFGTAEPRTLYKYTCYRNIKYMFLAIGESDDKLLIIGPYLSMPVSRSQIFEMGEKMGISPKDQRLLEGLFAAIPVLGDSSHIFAVIETFCESIWGKEPPFQMLDINKERNAPAFQLGGSKTADDAHSVMINMQMMEERYKYENELMDAVSRGQTHKVNLLLASFGDLGFEKRVANPLRNGKNYSIIMNTLLRKAAERGGVHPLYLDGLSSSFAARIEQLSDFSNVSELMSEMFTSYCRLVRKHSMKNLSPIVRKVILTIESDLSADLTLSSLAASQKVSAGHLSTIFKRETGKTLTEYISDKRIALASHLLASTHLQIQTIALHCGIMDVQYFSKTFKKKTGKTPKEYRESVR